MTWYWFFVILFGVLLFIEAVTFNLVSVWLSLSALLTAIYAYFFPGQPRVYWFIFVVLSLLLLAATKPFVKKLKVEKQSTNSDRLIGEDGVVTERIDNIAVKGLVKVKGQIWSARSINEKTVEEGESVKINKIEGVKLIVK
jgi:membrane protein implicated in regulation of membrane protease activity